MTREKSIEGKCRSCSQNILWARWVDSGKAVPIDPIVASAGNIVLTKSRTTGELRAEKYDANHHAGRNRYVTHFKSCPHATQHRRSA